MTESIHAGGRPSLGGPRNSPRRPRVDAVAAESEKILADVETLLGFGHYVLDVRTGVWTSSDALDRIFGIGPEFVRDVDGWASLIHPDDRDEMSRYFAEEVVGRKQRFEKEYRIARASDGEERWVFGTGRLELDEEGCVVRMLGAIQDITDRRKAEQDLRDSEEKFKSLFDRSVVGKSFTLPTGELSANQALASFLGYSREELQQKRWQDISHPDDLELTRRAVDSVLSGERESVRFVKRYLTRDGAIVWGDVSTTLCRDRDGHPLYFMTVVVDITERKRAEDEIRRLNADLESRVRARTAELEAALGEMEAFSYSVAHDLRAPIRAIHGFTSLLTEDYGGLLDEEGRRLLATVQKSAFRMGLLIDDLLEFSRVGRTEMKTSSVDLSALASLVLDEVIPAFERGRYTVRVAELPRAQADPRLVEIVLRNLISNAVKFSTRRERPVVEVGSGETDGVAAYSVRDNGVGFDQKYVGKLFGIFQRLHGVDEFEGTGIGLALVKRIVERHGGKVWAEGEKDRGATFWFTLAPGVTDPGARAPS